MRRTSRRGYRLLSRTEEHELQVSQPLRTWTRKLGRDDLRPLDQRPADFPQMNRERLIPGPPSHHLHRRARSSGDVLPT